MIGTATRCCDRRMGHACGSLRSFWTADLLPLQFVNLPVRPLFEGKQWRTIKVVARLCRQPPRGIRQASIQGGTLVFVGQDCVWSHYDKATADHANFDTVVEVVKSQKVTR